MGSRWRLAERAGWALSGREVELFAVLLDGRVLVRVGEWTLPGPGRACETMALCEGELADLLRGAVRMGWA